MSVAFLGREKGEPGCLEGIGVSKGHNFFLVLFCFLGRQRCFAVFAVFLFIYLFLLSMPFEGGRGRGRQRERNVLLSCLVNIVIQVAKFRCEDGEIL